MIPSIELKCMQTSLGAICTTGHTLPNFDPIFLLFWAEGFAEHYITINSFLENAANKVGKPYYNKTLKTVNI